MMRGVHPYPSSWFIAAPLLMSKFIISFCFDLTARCRGDTLSALQTFGSAPFVSNSSAMFIFFRDTARNRGVNPFLKYTSFMKAPRSKKYFTLSSFSLATAKCRGEKRLSSGYAPY
ncbi:ORF-9 [Teiidae poxvirus 1]|nr:ORF-9 [Teiidae poxvirus 1]